MDTCVQYGRKVRVAQSADCATSSRIAWGAKLLAPGLGAAQRSESLDDLADRAFRKQSDRRRPRKACRGAERDIGLILRAARAEQPAAGPPSVAKKRTARMARSRIGLSTTKRLPGGRSAAAADYRSPFS